jgi:outer membrane protein assembly factor BamE (lipoprotein component of BamABCDE complex)
MRCSALGVAVALLATVPAFSAESPNTLTHGMAQMTLNVGQTSQLQVLEAFGAPNITTLDGNGSEVWIYDRHATVSSTNNSSFSIGMLIGGGGGGVGAGGGLGFGKSKSKAEQSTRTMTLIIKFDASKKVSDFKSRSSSF